MSDELVFEFAVDCAAEHAFETWTRRASLWWPKGHSKSGDPGLVVVIEEHPEGRIFERTPGGEEHDWGVVTEWAPPHRFAYLWHIYGTREEATHVVISFTARGSSTDVRIVHTGWEHLGDKGKELRARNLGGWQTLAAHFTEGLRDGRGPRTS
jgi:hypothetical protein